MQFAQISEESGWTDEVPYASAFENEDVEAPNSRQDHQEEPKKRDRKFSSGKTKTLLGSQETSVRGTAVKRCCCCHPLAICASVLLVIILICAGVVFGFLVADKIEKDNEVKTPCTDKQTGETCIMDTGPNGVCKLADGKLINDGELVCDDVTLYEAACKQKGSDDTCVLEGMPAGKCMYTSSTSKVLWCDIPRLAEVACIGADTKPKATGADCELSVGDAVEQGTCEVVVYSRRKRCIVPDPDEEICASLEGGESCETSGGKVGTCEQMMDNQLKCVETAPVVVDMRIVAVILVGSGIVLLGLISFTTFCYCRLRKKRRIEF